MTSQRFKLQLRHALRRDLWITLAPALLLIGAAFALAYYFVEPAPPKHLVLATGSDEGGSRYYAKRYKELLARDGITLELRPTQGSSENVALLADPDSGVDVAFVQGGTLAGKTATELVSLGSVAYIPLWIFHRGEELDDLRALSGRRIAIGPEHSATHALALQLLTANGVEKAPTVLLPLERKDAIAQLEAGAIDAAFLVSPAEAPAIQKLAAVPGIQLLSLLRGEAYSRRFPSLTRLVLPRGVFGFALDVPPRDVTLVSPTSDLVTRTKLHPALAYLLMRTATEVHTSAGLLDRAGEFPAARAGGFPLSDEARRYYASGAPLLQRYLPFWAANLVDRLWVLLLPIIAVLLPLMRVIPPLYRWRVRSRIYRWYARLKEVELQLEEAPDHVSLLGMLARLDDVERAVNRIPTPLSYSDTLYVFREHLELVRRRIVQRLAALPQAVQEAPKISA